MIGCAAITIAWVLLWQGIAFAFQYYKVRIGIDTHVLKCLDYYVYVVHQGKPERVVRGDYLQFVDSNLDIAFPHGYKIVKKVGAVPGDTVEVASDLLFVNGKFIDRLNLRIDLGKPFKFYDRKFVVPAGEYLMLGTRERSYDGRYWGTVPEYEILGKATPVF